MSLPTYFLVLIGALFVLELVYFRIADRFNIIDKPNERSSHTRITLRGGGIIFYLGMALWFVLSGFAHPWFFAALSVLAIVSFIDDVHSLPPSIRLVAQISGLLLLCAEWGLFIYPEGWVIVPVALFACAGITNIYNFMDGINGITGGYSLVVLLALLAVDKWALPFADEKMMLAAIASALVFCFFNFRTKARCFAGDVGSVSMAVIVIFLLGQLILVSGDLSWLVFLVVYGVDGTLTILHRLQLGERISQPHRKHAFQLLANELHWPHVCVSLLYMSLQAIVCTCCFFFPVWQVLLCASLVLGVAYIVFMKKYFHLHLQRQ
ncbi:MAG: glycosyltransferase family 4 protein [Alloprevotella sp.]|nr:glycosyltransferase family 4 protein [Alloprevotella sp.]